MIGDVKITVYDTPDNKTVDINQDGDKLVLTHQQAIDLSTTLIDILKV